MLHLKTTTSTMDIAAKLVAEGNPETIILADEQTAGRGRQARPWQTFTAPHSMAATFIFRLPPTPHLPLLVALALHQTLSGLVGQGPSLTIKWPNDLLLNNKKLSGILIETIPTAPTTYLIGIGLNLTPPPEIPPSFQGAFLTSGHQLIPPSTLAESISACINQYLTLYTQHGWSKQLHNSYLQHCSTIGQKVAWNRGLPNEIHGLARSLNESGALELVAEDGTVHLIHSGEIMAQRA